MKFIGIVFLSLLPFNIIAQNYAHYTFPWGESIAEINYQTKGPNGRILLYSEWKNGSFYTFDDKKLENIPMLLNLYHNQIVVDIDNTLKSLNFKAIQSIIIDKKEYYTSYNFLMNDNKVGIFDILYNKNIKIAKLLFIKKDPANYNEILDTGSREDSYNLTETLYIIFANNKAFKVPKNKKAYAELFKGNEKQMLNFSKKENIKTSNTSDLIKSIDYFNSL